MTKFPAARVLIIFGVLVSLCVSDNVGPRLLPLPPVTELASGPNLTGPGQIASRAPSRGRSAGARVEMVSAAQNRAGAERQSPQAAPHALKFELAVPSGPNFLKPGLNPSPAESPAPFSRPKGRAPPRLL